MAEPEPTADGVPERTFTDNLRRIVRRQPDMSEEPVDVQVALALGVLALVFGAAFGAVMVLLAPESPPLALMITLLPVLVGHLEGVRHRWWAAGAATVSAGATGVAVASWLADWMATGWANLLAVLAASAVATAVHTATTHLPRRGRVKEQSA
jgi:hypothetical protein